MRRALPAAVALVIASAVMLPASATTPASTGKPVAAKAVAKQVKTPFLMGASAYGTRVRGEAIPAGSSETGYQVIGCNSIANKSKTNFIQRVEIPGLGAVNGVRTTVWTEKKGSRTSSFSRQAVASIELIDSPLGALRLGAIESVSEAFNVGGPDGRYGTRITNSLAKLTFTPPDGSPTTMALPSPGSPVVIPGLARIAIGKKVTDKGVDFAEGRGTSLRITVIPTDTSVVVGQTRAYLALARTRGLFNGYGAGVEARVIGETAQVGRNAYQAIPCIGTDGEPIINRLNRVDLSPLAETGVSAALVEARRTSTGAIASASGRASRISLGDGALEVTVVTAVAEVRRTKSGALTRSAKGTHVGAITLNGTVYSLDDLNQLEIPGVARLEGNIKERFANGLKVIGLRVTLLDGSLGVVNLAVAVAKIRPTKK